MCRVLIIEDDAVAALDIQGVLASAGATSFGFADCLSEALECARAEPPKVITSDVLLGSDFGPDVVARVLDEIGEVPVIYITATPEECPAAPRERVFEKPFDAGRLRDAFIAILKEAGLV